MPIIDRTAYTSSVTTTRNNRRIISRFGNGTRDTTRIDAIILHQTSFVSTSIERFNYVIAHYVVMQDGTTLKVRNHDVKLNSVGARNAINIEFVGNYANERTLRRYVRRSNRGLRVSSYNYPPVAQVIAGRALIRTLKNELASINSIFAHRQLTPGRKGNCPGPHLWFNVGQWACEQFGLTYLNSGGTGDIPLSWREKYLDAWKITM